MTGRCTQGKRFDVRGAFDGVWVHGKSPVLGIGDTENLKDRTGRGGGEVSVMDSIKERYEEQIAALKGGDMDERFIFEFVKPLPGKLSGPWSQWHLVVGGWEISGNSKQELLEQAILLLKREEIRLKDVRGEEVGKGC